MRAMRGAVLEAVGKLTVGELVVEDPRPGEVLVRVTDCGVCHSDLSFVDGHFPGAFPIVLGHEAGGVIEAVGDGVVSLAAGDKVVLCPLPNCGHCYFCVRSQPTLCATYSMNMVTATRSDGSTPISRAGADGDQVVYRGVGVGGWAEYTVVPQEAAVKVPDDVNLAEACVVGCALQTGVGAVLNTANVEAGATVLVQGAGGIGIAVTQGARVAGATTIVVADPVAARREAALRFGATHVVDPTSTDVVGFCSEVTGGIGVDYAFEAAGVAKLIETALSAIRSGGTAVCVGAPPIMDGISLPGVAGFTITEKKLIGCALGSVNAQRDIPRFLNLARNGQVDLAGMITDRYDLGDVEAAVDNLRDRKGIRTTLKIA